MSQCQFCKQDGQRCRAHALRGGELCISHDPAAKDVKREAVTKGGRNRRTRVVATRPSKPLTVTNIADVQHQLYQTLGGLQNGTVDAEMARAFGYLAGVAAKIVETVELERRMTAVEDWARRVTEEGEA